MNLKDLAETQLDLVEWQLTGQNVGILLEYSYMYFRVPQD